MTELSESEKNNVLDNVLTQIILDENKPKLKAPDETFTDAIAATAKPKSNKKRSAKSDADRRFTLQEAVDFYNSAHPSDRPLKANSLKQNAKMYGFMIKERGSGLYALIDS